MYTRIALKVSYSDVGDGGVAENCEKNTIFPEHPVYKKRTCHIFEVSGGKFFKDKKEP